MAIPYLLKVTEMDEKLQQQINNLADAIKERLIATLNLKIDFIARSPLDELDYRITKDLISMGVNARALTLAEALIFHDRLEAAYLLSEDTAPFSRTHDLQDSFPGGDLFIGETTEPEPTLSPRKVSPSPSTRQPRMKA